MKQGYEHDNLSKLSQPHTCSRFCYQQVFAENQGKGDEDDVSGGFGHALIVGQGMCSYSSVSRIITLYHYVNCPPECATSPPQPQR